MRHERDLERILAPDQLELVRDLQTMSIIEIAGAHGVDRRTMWYRARRIIQILEDFGLDASDIRMQVSQRRRRTLPLSGLRGKDLANAGRYFGDGDLSPAVCSPRRQRAAFAARMGRRY